MDSFTLKSGYDIPVLGLGTWKLTGSTCTKTIPLALEMGYRHIDTAYEYKNQPDIAQGIKNSGIDRPDLFITSKIWKDHMEHDNVLEQADETLEQLDTDYLDLLLIHWPVELIPVEETLSAFAELVEKEKVRSIGVSNFTVGHMKQALKVTEEPICNNQIKFNPHEGNQDVLDFCKEINVAVTAYSPLDRANFSDDEHILENIAASKNRSPAQVSLRWLLQKGMIIIPRSSSKQHLEENMDVFEWELTDEEMQRIEHIND